MLCVSIFQQWKDLNLRSASKLEIKLSLMILVLMLDTRRGKPNYDLLEVWYRMEKSDGCVSWFEEVQPHRKHGSSHESSTESKLEEKIQRGNVLEIHRVELYTL